MVKNLRHYQKPRGNMRTEVTTAFGVQGVVDAVSTINMRTQWKNAQQRDSLHYQSQRRKVTLPHGITAWLKKEV